MRGAVAGLPSPHPLMATLPGLYQGHSLTERLCGSLDDVLAPVVSALDNLHAYLDVTTSPDDLLPWLSYWLGMPGDGRLTPARLREVLHAAHQLHGWQGTRRGIELAVESVVGFRTVVQETGATDWSVEADASLPGSPHEALVVEVHVPAGGTVNEARLEALVVSLKPAHIVHRVTVVRDA